VGKDLLNQIEDKFIELGECLGSELEDLALSADKNPPKLIKRLRDGSLSNTIEKHPDFIKLEKIAFEKFGLAAMSHRAGVFEMQSILPPIIKYGLTFLFVQNEFGLCCPVSMTDSLTRTLKKFGDERLITKFFDQLTSQDLDELFQGAMFMTEQHAGSDVGSIDTIAESIDGEWYLTGDKWFCSNPDADLAMVLARYDKNTKGTRGLSLFLLPKKLENGQPNNYEIIRLKDKLGGRSFASGEIRLNKAFAYIVGEKTEGFKQMTDMINMSRLSNGVRASGMMQRCLQESLFIAKTRSAFNEKLINLPLIRKQLLKILIIAEASRTMVFKAAEILEKADKGDTEAQKIFRIITPLIKFRACRDVRKIAGDAMEIRGGAGYIEEWLDPKILRDAHLGSIWEGTSNIISLDTIRAIKKADNIYILKNFLVNLVQEKSTKGNEKVLLSTIDDVFNFVLKEINDDHASSSRQITSLLYYLCSAVFLNYESYYCTTLSHRKKISALIIKHKINGNNPLQRNEIDYKLLEEYI
jgi:alkylation response protein AidB-like acyl-CoA dehydrogenase